MFMQCIGERPNAHEGEDLSLTIELAGLGCEDRFHYSVWG